MLGVYAVLYLVGSLWFAVDLVFVERSLGMPKESVRLLWTASGAGGLAGSAFVAAASRRVSPGTLLLTGLGVRSMAIVWYAVTTDYVRALAAALFAGLGGALLSVAVGRVLVARTSPGSVGRVTALFDTIGQLASVLALLAVSARVTVVTPAQTLLISGLVLSMVSVGAALRMMHSGAQAASRTDE